MKKQFYIRSSKDTATGLPLAFQVVIDDLFLWYGVFNHERKTYDYRQAVNKRLDTKGWACISEEQFYKTMKSKKEIIKNLLSAYGLYVERLMLKSSIPGRHQISSNV